MAVFKIMYIRVVCSLLLVVFSFFFLEDVLSPHFVADNGHFEETLCFDSTPDHPCPFADHNTSSGAHHKEAHFGHIQFVLSRVNILLTASAHIFLKNSIYEFHLKTSRPPVLTQPPILA
ncbi:MAG: hypothetical protein K2Q26_08780 [Bdellovibrionales bacterium]|nr:hypothetical protein [Bdellovibrionales bacterium]